MIFGKQTCALSEGFILFRYPLFILMFIIYQHWLFVCYENVKRAHQYNSIYFSRPFVPNIGIELNMTLLYSMKILAHMSSYAHSTQYNLKYLFIPLPTFRTLFTFFRCDVMSRYKHERYLIMVIQITLYATTAYSVICMHLR